MKAKSTLGKFNFGKTPHSFQNFIAKVTDPVYSKQIRIKQSSQEHIYNENEEIYSLSIQMLKELAQEFEIQFTQLQQDCPLQFFTACIEKLGFAFNHQYNEKCQQLNCQIKNIKRQLSSNTERLTLYAEQNDFLKDEIERIETERNMYNQQLDKSEHQLEKGKNQIQIQINERQILNHELETFRAQYHHTLAAKNLLNSQVKRLNEQFSTCQKQRGQLRIDLNKKNSVIQFLQKQKQQLNIEKQFLEKQVQSFKKVLQEKDYLLQSKYYKQQHQTDSLNYSAQRHAMINKSHQFNIVTEQKDQQYGSDKDVLKDIEYQNQITLGVLKFSNSKSGSDASQTSLRRRRRNYEIQSSQEQFYILDTPPNKQIQQNKLEMRLSQSSQLFQSKNFSKDKQSKKEVAKQNFHTPIPKDKSRKVKNISVTLKNQRQTKQSIKKHHQSVNKPEQSLKKQKKSFNLNLDQIKSQTKSQYNEHVILSGGREKIFQDQRKSLQSNSMFNLRGQHCQSAQNLFPNQASKKRQSQRKSSNNDFQSVIRQKDKLISNLKIRVKQTELEASQKLTQHQGQYEMILQKLESKVKYYKSQFQNTYNDLIIEKANSEQFQKQIQKLRQQVYNQKQAYDLAYLNLKQKCNTYLEDQTHSYKLKYAQIQQKMQKMLQNNLADKHKQSIQNSLLKKSNSSTLFFNQIKYQHHSYHCSQDYSQINKASPNAYSKQMSLLCSQSDKLQNNVQNNQKPCSFHQRNNSTEIINIQDRDQLLSWAGQQVQQPRVNAQVQTDQIEQFKSSINLSSFQLSQDNSVCKNQETTFKSCYIQEKIAKLHISVLQQMKFNYQRKNVEIARKNLSLQTQTQPANLQDASQILQGQKKIGQIKKFKSVQNIKIEVIYQQSIASKTTIKPFAICSNVCQITIQYGQDELRCLEKQKSIFDNFQKKLQQYNQKGIQTQLPLLVQSSSETTQQSQQIIDRLGVLSTHKFIYTNQEGVQAQFFQAQRVTQQVQIQFEEQKQYFSEAESQTDKQKIKEQLYKSLIQHNQEKSIQTSRTQCSIFSYLSQIVNASKNQNKQRKMGFSLNQINLNFSLLQQDQPKIDSNNKNGMDCNYKLQIVKCSQFMIHPCVKDLNNSKYIGQSYSQQLNESDMNMHSFSTELDQSLLSQLKKILVRLKQNSYNQPAYQTKLIQQAKKIQSNIEQLQRFFANIEVGKAKKQQTSLEINHQKEKMNQELQKSGQQLNVKEEDTQKIQQKHIKILQKLQNNESLELKEQKNQSSSSTHFLNSLPSSVNFSTTVSSYSSPQNEKQNKQIKQFSSIKQQEQQIQYCEDEINNSLQNSGSCLANKQKVSFSSFQIKKKDRKTDKKKVVNVQQLIRQPKKKSVASPKYCKTILNNIKQLQFLMQEQKNYIARKFRLKNINITEIVQFKQDLAEIQTFQRNRKDEILYSTNRPINTISSEQMIILHCSIQNKPHIKENFAISAVKIIDLTRKIVLTNENGHTMTDSNMLLLGNNQIRITKNSFQISLINKTNHFQSAQNIQDGKWRILKALICKTKQNFINS